MNFKELKKYIYDNNKIEDVLSSIGCHHIKPNNKGYYSCANINGDNLGAINIQSSEFLFVRNYTRTLEKEFKKDLCDIYDLTTYNLRIKTGKEISLNQSREFLHRILGLEFSNNYNKENKSFDPLSVFKKVVSWKYDYDKDCDEIQKIELYDYYPHIIHESWLPTGLTQKTINKFDIGYSFRMKRIVIPIRYWKDGSVIGYNNRSTVENCEEFGIKKYLLSHDYQKHLNLYGLWENKKYIEKNKVIVLFEAEKSVLRRDSRCDHNCVALQGHTLSKEQVSIICGLDVNEIVIAMDKDININEVRSLCERFYQIRKVSYIWDENNLLDNKDSPADSHNEIYRYLFNHRVNYDYKEHKLFEEVGENKKK